MEVNNLGFVAIVLFVGFPTAFLFIPYAKKNA